MKLQDTLVRLLLALMVCSMVASCGSSRTLTGADGKSRSHRGAVATTTGNDGSRGASKSSRLPSGNLDPVAAALLKEAYSWQGIPYKWGGNTREEGVDCSGFVLQVYKSSLGINLPRTSRQQHSYCTPIKRSELMPGDLVFFATGDDPNVVSHVGIYVGENKMIHSSSSKGVIESSLLSDYYSSHYLASGRVDSFYAKLTPARKPAEQPTAVPTAPKAKKEKKKGKSGGEGSSRDPSKAGGEGASRTPGNGSANPPVVAAHHGARQQSGAGSAVSTSSDDYRSRVLSGLPED